MLEKENFYKAHYRIRGKEWSDIETINISHKFEKEKLKSHFIVFDDRFKTIKLVPLIKSVRHSSMLIKRA